MARLALTKIRITGSCSVSTEKPIWLIFVGGHLIFVRKWLSYGLLVRSTCGYRHQDDLSSSTTGLHDVTTQKTVHLHTLRTPNRTMRKETVNFAPSVNVYKPSPCSNNHSPFGIFEGITIEWRKRGIVSGTGAVCFLSLHSVRILFFSKKFLSPYRLWFL